MNAERSAMAAEIKAKIIEIARQLGADASGLAPDDIVPATGFIDSAGLLELIGWYEDHFKIRISQEEITIDNLGSVDLMVDFALRRKGLA